jgi:thiol:disulfide interchange protein DsbD
LVSADQSVQPGRPFTVVVRLSHKPHWHTYWKNPGNGLATSLQWTLPAGWTAGEIQWPVPQLVVDDDGHLTGTGYGGDLWLPVQITPPATLKAGEQAKIEVAAKWLMCRDACMEGTAALSLELPIRETAPSVDPHWKALFDRALSRVPRADEDWAFSAYRVGASIRLVLQPKSRVHATLSASSPLHFFSENDLIAFEAPQTVSSAGAAQTVLSLDVSPDASAEATRLRGVLALPGGGIGDAGAPAVAIDLPIQSGS